MRGAVQRARGRGGGQGRAVPSAAGGARPVGAVCSVRQMQGGRQHGRRRVGSGRGERSTWPPRRAGRMAQGTGARGRAAGGWGPGQYRARRAGRGGPEDRRAMGSTGGRRMGGGLRGTADTGGGAAISAGTRRRASQGQYQAWWVDAASGVWRMQGGGRCGLRRPGTVRAMGSTGRRRKGRRTGGGGHGREGHGFRRGWPVRERRSFDQPRMTAR